MPPRGSAQLRDVDADLRRPTVATHFGVPSVPGLAGLLNGTTSFEACVRRVDRVPGLGVLPTAAVPDAGDLVARNLNAVLQRARGDYDVVIVDSPPLLAGDDAGTYEKHGYGQALETQIGHGIVDFVGARRGATAWVHDSERDDEAGRRKAVDEAVAQVAAAVRGA